MSTLRLFDRISTAHDYNRDNKARLFAGPLHFVLAAGKTVGPEVDDAELLSIPTEQLDIVVTKKDVANRTIKPRRQAKSRPAIAAP